MAGPDRSEGQGCHRCRRFWHRVDTRDVQHAFARPGGCHGEDGRVPPERQAGAGARRGPADTAPVRLARRSRPPWAAVRVRPRPMRRVHRQRRGRGGALVRDTCLEHRAQARPHAGGTGHARTAAPAAAGLHRRAGSAMRLLHQRNDHAGQGDARRQSAPERGGDQARAVPEPLPLRNAPPDSPRHPAGSRHRQVDEESAMKIAISRRRFLEGSGSLVVTFSLGALAARKAAAAGPAASKAASAAPAAKTVALDEVDGFIAIGADGKVTVYSGKVDLGTGVRTALAQIAAEELCVPLASIEVVQGDTLLTPDQGPTYGSLSIQNGGTQIRQAAATAREALLAQGAEQLRASRA